MGQLATRANATGGGRMSALAPLTLRYILATINIIGGGGAWCAVRWDSSRWGDDGEDCGVSVAG